MTVDSSLTARSDEAARYVDGVAAQLADLPDDDRADLLDELAAHVDELVAEGDTPLTDRLGSPAEYAAELLASAGLPPARARGRAGAQALDRLRRAAGHPRVRAASDFADALRPVWWVLRAWVVVGLVAMWPGQTTPTWADFMPLVPRVGTPLVGLLVLLAAVVASVQLGRRTPLLGARRRWAVVALNVGTALLLVPVLGSVGEATHPNDVYLDAGTTEVPPHEGVFAAGHQVWNIYAYDASGRMLHDVRLFDQSGRPLSLGLSPDSTRQVVVDAQGRLVENAFPYRYLEPDGTVAHPDAGPTVVAPPLGGSAASPAPSASASPSASPTGAKR
jgi:hypothetical protein